MGQRERLIAHADVRRASELSTALSDVVNRALNDADVSMATSLMARALIAEALIAVAAHWWADRGSLSVPDARTALLSFLDELPPGLSSVCFVDPAILGASN